MNSREKGKRVERQFRDLLREHGFNAYRGQQFCGIAGNGDIICKALPIHWEVKGVEKLNVYKAWEQAERDAAGESDVTASIPVVSHKKNGTDFFVTLKAGTFLEILRRSDLVEGNYIGNTSGNTEP